MKTAVWVPLAVTGLAHALLLAVPLYFDPPDATSDPVITVRLRPPQPEPEHEPEPPPPEPEPEPPPPEPEPELPRDEPPPKPKAQRDEPRPEPPPELEPEPPPPEPPPPEPPPPVHDAAIPAATSPNATARVPTRPEAPRGPSKAELRTYGMGIHAAMVRHRRYPPAALQQRLEGVVKVKLVIDRRGRLVGKPEVATSSGHRVLDEEALRMARAAAPFPPIPDSSDKDAMTIVIPMAFSLRE